VVDVRLDINYADASATFQGGIIPDTILYLSYWYTGRSVGSIVISS
jgi:hypothetical protein